VDVGDPLVHDPLRDRVLAAVLDTHYRPDHGSTYTWTPYVFGVVRMTW
jgi:hypothetical protein